MVIFLLAVLMQPTVAVPSMPQLVLAEQQTPRAPKHGAKPAPDDFDLLPKEAVPDPATLARHQALEQELALRRRMLNYHQMAGFLTLGSLTATVVLGQLDYLDKYGGRGDVGTYHQWHRWVAFASTAIFAGTASLAVFAPVPIPKEQRLDRTTLHKIAMTIAATGMAAQIVLGIVTASTEGRRAQRDYALAHQIIGYTTLAAAFTGLGVFTF